MPCSWRSAYANFSANRRIKMLLKANRLERKKAMEDFPIWLKLSIWLIVGATVLYAVGAVLYTVLY
jgi:hypothetical protein